jgi:hypothetical protein
MDDLNHAQARQAQRPAILPARRANNTFNVIGTKASSASAGELQATSKITSVSTAL